MAIVSILIDAVYNEPHPEQDRRLEQHLTAELLNEFRLISDISIDRRVEGDINLFAEMVDEMGCIRELENSFPGIRDYLTHHILAGITDWNDEDYCRCVAIGLLRFIGRHAEAMG